MLEAGVALRAQVERELDLNVRPYLQSHAGTVQVVAIEPADKGATVVVGLQGACRHCDLRTVTFAATVRARLMQVPGIGRVRCQGIALSDNRLDGIAAFFDTPRDTARH